MRVMQCWDDGDVDDIKLIDILKKHKAKATFNINPGGWQSERRIAHKFKGEYDVWRLALDEMPDVYKGFQVAGHTMTHPLLTKINPKWALTELVECKQYIKENFGVEECGMAYPCGAFDDNVKKLVEQAGYRYARTTLNVDCELNVDDPMALNTQCHFSHDDFWEKFEKVKELDGDFYFWGHTFELMNDDKRWDDLEAMIARISEDPKTEWCDVIDLFV